MGSRYGPNVVHTFTEWDANIPGMSMYDARADFRSWADTMDFLQEIFSNAPPGTSKPTAAQCAMLRDPATIDASSQPCARGQELSCLVHQGHCSDGWLGSSSTKNYATLADCYQSCVAAPDCGYVSYDA